jgi:hypothetical protein
MNTLKLLTPGEASVIQCPYVMHDPGSSKLKLILNITYQ